MDKSKQIKQLSLTFAVVLLLFSIYSTMNIDGGTIFTLHEDDFVLTVDSDTTYHVLFTGFDAHSGDGADVYCSITKPNNYDSYYRFECNSPWNSETTFIFNLGIENNTTNEPVDISPMGSSSITINEFESIAKVELPEGSYTVSVQSNTASNSGALRLTPNMFILNILLTVFGFIGTTALFVIYFVYGQKYRQSLKHQMYHSDDYYTTQMNETDRNQELFDDEDPFSKFD